MRFILAILILFIFSCSWAYPVWAQGKAPPDDMAQKRSLVLQFFESRPPRVLVDASIEGIANSRYQPNDPAREEFISRMQLAVDYDEIESLTLKTMVELYTVPELQSMVNYYGSETGKSAELKGKDLREKVAPILKNMLDRGLLDVVTTPSPADTALDSQ